MDIGTAIKAINSNAQYSINAGDFNQISWLNGTVPISKEDIEVKMVELQVKFDANKYQRDREVAFTSIGIGNQLDMQYWDLVNGTTTWVDAVAKVKEDNPKPDGWKE